MNIGWHQRNKMPKTSDIQHRVAWHLKHQRVCKCRPIPKGVLAVMSLRDRIRYANSILPGTPAADGAEDPRWQAIIAISEYIESSPEGLWQFTERWGTCPQEDLRNAIATCLLEHLLEHHFKLIFPRVRRLAKANGLFADTFSRC